MIEDTQLIEPQLKRYIQEIQNTLDTFLREKIALYTQTYNVLAQFYQNIYEFINRGGKRIHPLLLRLGYEGVGGKTQGNINLASCCVELLHNSSLFHDDLVDRDEVRRGGPTFHVLYHDLYKEQFPTKTAKHIGDTFALLAGNAVWNLGLSAILEAGFPGEPTIKAVSCYRNMFNSLIDGVTVEESMVRGEEVSEKKYLDMVNLKTSTLLQYALKIGGLLGEGSINQISPLEVFGEKVGQAFQIQDDVLGSFGSKNRVGKPVDSDIKAGKQTIIALKAFKKANTKQTAILEKYFANPQASRSEVEKVRTVFKETGALKYAIDLAKTKLEEAKQALQQANPPLNTGVVKSLYWIADYIINREQ